MRWPVQPHPECALDRVVGFLVPGPFATGLPECFHFIQTLLPSGLVSSLAS
jgi:hypothetical protein